MIHLGRLQTALWLLGLGIVLSRLSPASPDLRAAGSAGNPEATGYFDGRLWRIGVRPDGQSRLALDAPARLYVSGLDLGITAGVFPDIARWDGRRWEALATHVHRVDALLPVGSDLLAAGRTTEIDAVPLNRVARFDGSGWRPMGEGLGGSAGGVLALAADGGQVYAGGRFPNSGALSLTNIARWDIASESWHALGDGLPGEVRAITASQNGVFAGAGEQVYRWTGSAWEPLGTFVGQGGFPAQVLALQWRDDALYAAGSIPVQDRPVFVARLEGDLWETVTPQARCPPSSISHLRRIVWRWPAIGRLAAAVKSGNGPGPHGIRWGSRSNRPIRAAAGPIPRGLRPWPGTGAGFMRDASPRPWAGRFAPIRWSGTGCGGSPRFPSRRRPICSGLRVAACMMTRLGFDGTPAFRATGALRMGARRSPGQLGTLRNQRPGQPRLGVGSAPVVGQPVLSDPRDRRCRIRPRCQGLSAGPVSVVAVRP